MALRTARSPESIENGRLRDALYDLGGRLIFTYPLIRSVPPRPYDRDDAGRIEITDLKAIKRGVAVSKAFT